MNNPRHEKVRLRPTERAEFIAIAQRFGLQASDRAVPSTLGWRSRARVLFFSHLFPFALLLPIGVAAMGAALLVWWPLGLLAAGLVGIGVLATIELIRGRHLRRHIQSTSTSTRRKS